MKKALLLLSLSLLLNLTLKAQAPQGFNYQAVARNTTGVAITNQNIGLVISLRQGSATGTIVYTETFNVTSNNIGLVNVVVGTGAVTTGTFNTINWASGVYYIEISMDVTGGTSYALMGTQQLMSVPYALYALNSGGTVGATGATGNNGTNGIDGATGATGNDGTNGTNGTDGATGATGTAGSNGNNGTNGIDGATGATGNDGTNGIDGATGTNGTNGIDGATGATGNNGTNGIDGATGATGTNGTNGLAGATGATGNDGTNGINGATGATGPIGGFTHYLGESLNGGIIYYLYKGSDGLEHGLIVSLTENPTIVWQTVGTLVNANRTEDGAYNTALMTGSPAATYITSLGAGWYLPSINELELLYYNSYTTQKALRAGGYTLLSMTAYYWSSTEYNTTDAYWFSFNSAYRGYTSKPGAYTVRGIRAF